MHGIYKIVNTKNKHFYIGSSVNIEKRWKFHIWKLNLGKHENPHLQRAWQKYGADAFKLSVVKKCSDTISLLEIEQPYLDKWVGKSICYNIASSASATMQGRHHSEETKNKIGASNAIANKGKTPSEATRKKMLENNVKYWLGKERSKETKEKLSVACGGINSPRAKWSIIDIRNIRQLFMDGRSIKDIARQYGMNGSTHMSRIIRYIAYKHVDPEQQSILLSEYNRRYK